MIPQKYSKEVNRISIIKITVFKQAATTLTGEKISNPFFGKRYIFYI